MMRYFYGLMSAFMMLVLMCGCGDSHREQFDAAILEGNLSQAQKILTVMDHSTAFYDCCAVLIDEYLAVENIDKAIYVFDHISPHCTLYEMQFEYSYSTAKYTQQNAQKIYKALIAANRFDEAWSYHPLEYGTETYPGNAPCYFSYMVDVVTYLCVNNRRAEAQLFLNSHIHWFTKYVDNHESGRDYPQYSRSAMQTQLLDVLNTI